MRTSVMQSAVVALLLCVHSVQSGFAHSSSNTTKTTLSPPSSNSSILPPTSISVPSFTSRPPMNTTYPTTDTTPDDHTSPAMTTDDQMGKNKSVGVAVKMGLDMKGYFSIWYQDLCDMIMGKIKNDIEKGTGGSGSDGKKKEWEMKVNKDMTLFGGAERVVPMTLLTVLLGFCTRILF